MIRSPRALLPCAVAALLLSGPARAFELVAVQFNSGTTPLLPHDDDTTDGYTSAEAAISDQYYGDGLAWVTAIEAATAFFADLQPDVVAFQEIYPSDDCPGVPPQALPGFVCESWQSSLG